MAIINVLTVVDAFRIIHKFGGNDFATTNRYEQLPNQGEDYVYMFVTWNDASNEGLSELEVWAYEGDKIRWRTTTTSAGIDYQCFVKDIVVTRGARVISSPKLKKEIIQVPVIDPTDPNLERVIVQETEDIYWEATVEERGKVIYHLNFALYALGGGGGGPDTNCHGGYTYDPYIQTRT